MNVRRLSAFYALAAIGLPCSAWAAHTPDGGGDVKAGHSMHGEAFNEGPRQAATLIPGCGDVRFPITTKSEDAQKFFNQGIGQLHGFWYFEAERSFRQVAKLDPDCAIAYWGMAMANINNQKRAREFMKEAVARREKASRREQLYIDLLSAYHTGEKKDERQRREAMVRAYEELIFEFPDDLEAKAFLVFQLWDNKQHGVPLPSRLAVEALAQQVLDKSPMHPGIHHYLIHLWNYGGGDKRVVASAARCGQSAPGIAHMWHMSGHTFSELKRYSDAVWQQEASARVDHAYMQRARIMPEQIHNYAHNNEWCVRDLSHVGRARDAVDLARNLIELPRLGPGKQGAYNFGRERLQEVLLRYEMWDELAALDGSMYLSPYAEPESELRRQRAIGVAHFARGDGERGQAMLEKIKGQLAQWRAERLAKAEEAERKAWAERKPADQTAKAMADAMQPYTQRIAVAESCAAELRLYRALADGDTEEAKKQLAACRDISAERLAIVQWMAGEREQAEKNARDVVSKAVNQVVPLANLAYVLWEAGKKDEAKKTFEKLRALSAELELNAVPFQRVRPIAASLGLGRDWRVPYEVAKDAGERPPLESLGPFRWSPYRAPTWVLHGSNGGDMALTDYFGKPVLLVFYLGSGCLHCIEQLNALAPEAQAYADAGINIIAVSTEKPEDLYKTMEQAKGDNGFPYPILGDPDLTTFKAYRAYDDFEDKPLHGTFLIDGQGRVRWQNISFEPFQDVKWLLEESKRLLALPVAAEEATVGGRENTGG